MKFSQIEAQQCGAMTGLRIEGLQPGLNVILGPNGCGKTSLLRFVRELMADTLRTNGRVSSLPAAGTVELEDQAGTVRVIRIPRPGHPDTVATVAITSAVDGETRPAVGHTGDELADSLLRFVETSHLHQSPALAGLAREVTARLCAEDTGSSWPLVCAAAGASGDLRGPVLAALSRLTAAVDDPASNKVFAGSDLTAIDTNWRIVVASLERQREQLALECEARVRIQVRQQRELATRLRWLNERTTELTAEIQRLDDDWQAAASDLNEHSCETNADTPGTLPEAFEQRLRLLSQVIEDLAADRLQLTLQMARSPSDVQGALADERRRIEGCEREVIVQMQRLQRRRQSDHEYCEHCGRLQSKDSSTALAADDQRAQLSRDLQQELFEARRQLAATGCQSVRVQTSIRRYGLDPAIDRLRYEMQVLTEQIAELQSVRESELTATGIMIQLEMNRRHDILRHAGDYLTELTAGRYTGVRWDNDDSGVLVAGPSGELTPVGLLSRGTSEQVGMSLRLAILRGLARLGENGPILWDEPLADSDERRLTAAAEVLSQFAADENQILLFTCREHVARTLIAHGAHVHVLGRQSLPLTLHTDQTSTEQELRGPDATAAPIREQKVRVHPSSTFWLHAGAPLELVPSLGPQFARRLRSLGIAEIQDLLDFDPANGDGPLSELQIGTAQLQIWQAEARLLTEVPGLNGRDAQLLVSSGMLSRGDLANADVDELTRRIDRLRGGDTLRWRMGPSTAPHRETIERWVESARQQPPADPATWSDTRTRLRSERLTRRGRGARTHVSASPPAVASRFRLQPDSPIVDAPSIGHKTARRLERIGIATVRDLLACDPRQTALRLRHRRITAESMQVWQQQAGLMCSVPELRCADAIVLVACGVTGPLDLRRISATALRATIEPFVSGATGRRLLRGALPPTADDMARWIATVEESRIRRAA